MYNPRSRGVYQKQQQVTTVKYTRPNGRAGTSTTSSTGVGLARYLQKISNSGNRLNYVSTPYHGVMTGNTIYEFIKSNLGG